MQHYLFLDLVMFLRTAQIILAVTSVPASLDMKGMVTDAKVRLFHFTYFIFYTFGADTFRG